MLVSSWQAYCLLLLDDIFFAIDDDTPHVTLPLDTLMLSMPPFRCHFHYAIDVIFFLYATPRY